MQDTFVKRILELKNAEAEKIITELHSLFSEISSMDADQVVTAYQTIMTTANILDLKGDRVVHAMLSAIRNQMQFLSSNAPLRDSEAYTSRFRSVTGYSFTDRHGMGSFSGSGFF